MKKRLFGILLSLALMMGMMPVLGLSQTAMASGAPWEGDPYYNLVNTTTVIHFDNNKEWYLIEDNSKAINVGTVTLLSKECVGASQYDSNNSSTYSGSTVETFVNTWYTENISADAKTAVSDNKMFLLTTDQANATTEYVRKCSKAGGAKENEWWLCSPGYYDEFECDAACVDGGNGDVNESGESVTYTLGVRPAIKLDLSKVAFDSESKTFSIPTLYPLWVGGVQVTSANMNDVLVNDPVNAGKVSYTPATTSENPTPATLKLNGANITEGYDPYGTGYKYGIYYTGNEALDITLESGSENTIKVEGTDIYSYGIYSRNADLAINGKGKVTAIGSLYGIMLYDQNDQYWNLTIKDASVNASATKNNPSAVAAKNIKIINANVTATATLVGIHAVDSVTIEGGTVTASGGYRAISAVDSVTIKGGTVTASGGNQAIRGNVKNSIAGTGWTNVEGTEGKTTITVNENPGAELSYRKVQFPSAHTHSFTYTATGDTITATCSAEDCPLPVVDGKHVATLTIAAPKHTTYGDGNDAAAQITDENKIQGTAVVKYFNTDAKGGKTGEPLNAPPANAGKYWAEITLGTGDKSATAHVVYNIAKATPTISTNPTASAITYGQTLENSTLTSGAASVDGSFAWKTKTTAPSVADSQATEYDVVFTPNDSDNYDTATCKVKLTVNQKTVGLSWAGTDLTYNGQEQAPTATATELVSGDEGKVSVTVTGGQTNAGTYTATASTLTGDKAGNYKLPDNKTKSFTISPKSISEATVTLSETSLDYTGTEQSVSVTSVKLDGTELSADTDYTVSGNTGTDVGTYTVTVTGKGNYKDSAEAQWSITATPSIDPAPTASDITYGQTLSDSKLTGGKAKVGDTEVPGTFSWKNGSTRPSVDDSGKTEYTVVFTPTDTTKYKPAETKVKLTVNKGEPTAAAVTANNRKYDGTKKPLVTVDESILVGGTMQYALGKDAKTAPEEGWSETIPSAAEKGEYYVWYQVKGDDNHNDSAPQAVTVTISEKDPEPNESTITFDLNGGTLNGKTGKVTVTAANGTVITLPAPTRDGYTFDYWEGSKYNAGEQYTVNGDHTFKAVWKTGAGGNGKGGSSKKGVNTGDENTLGAWIVLLIAALTGTTGMAFARKRRND